MELILWRHGLAETHAASGKDEDRALLPEGAKGVAEAARALRDRMNAPPGRIYVSPYLRTRQTAESAQETLQCPGGLLLMKDLASGAEPSEILQALSRESGLPPAVALVGHMPDLGLLAEFWLNSPEMIRFSPGEWWLIEIDDFRKKGKGKKRFSYAPRNAG